MAAAHSRPPRLRQFHSKPVTSRRFARAVGGKTPGRVIHAELEYQRRERQRRRLGRLPAKLAGRAKQHRVAARILEPAGALHHGVSRHRRTTSFKPTCLPAAHRQTWRDQFEASLLDSGRLEVCFFPP